MNPVTRIVLDANVIVSALTSTKGAPARLLECWQEERFDVVVSPAILQELDRVLHYPRLQQRYHLREGDIPCFLRLLKRQAIEAHPTKEISVVDCDPTDNRYLECALAGEAQYVISGDQHLLELGEYQGLQILTTVGFLTLLKLEA